MAAAHSEGMTQRSTSSAANRREAARRPDGWFGPVDRPEATIGLGASGRCSRNRPVATTDREVPAEIRAGFSPRPAGLDAVRYLGRANVWRRSASYHQAVSEQVAHEAAERGWYAERTDGDRFEFTLPDGTRALRRVVDANIPGPHGSDGRELKLLSVEG